MKAACGSVQSRNPRRLARPSGRLAALSVALLLIGVPTGRADDSPAKAPRENVNAGADTMAARYVTLTSPIDDQLLSWVREAGLELQDEALKRERKAILVLEVTPGNSQFHQVYGLAEFLTSTALSRVKTIAWVPETVVGNNVIAALACNEIVMHPDAELGDIGRGRALDDDQQRIVIGMVAKRRNAKVNQALAKALMDPQATAVQLTFEPADGVTEKRLVTKEEANDMRDRGVVIRDSRTIKEAGQIGLFSGAQARNNDILAVQTLETRHDLATVYKIQLESLREQPRPEDVSNTRVIEVHGEITEGLQSFLMRQIDRAVADNARMIIFDINSPGGALYPSRDLAFAISDLEERGVRTIAYISREALSGGAIISLGCDEIYMTPNATFGSAGVISTLGELGKVERAKIESVLREWVRDLAERKNRPVALALAMVDMTVKAYEVTNVQTGQTWYMTEHEIHDSNGDWQQVKLVRETDDRLLLTVNGIRAHQLQIAERPVSDFDELKERIGVPVDLEPKKVARTWLDDAVFRLNRPAMTGFLLFVGIICLYLELHFMSGFLGIISALCFSIFFWSKFLGGTAGWLEVLLFLLGVGCIALEIFVIPGFGVFGVSGGLLIFASLIMASQTFGNLEPHADFYSATETMKVLSMSLVSVIVMAIALSRFLPKIPILNQMILTPPGMDTVASPDEPRLRPDLASQGPLASLIGQQGEALTVLRPAGKARIEGRLYDVVSEGPYIDRGDKVAVMQVAGNRIVVRKA